MKKEGSSIGSNSKTLVLGTTSKKFTCTAVLLFFNSNTFF